MWDWHAAARDETALRHRTGQVLRLRNRGPGARAGVAAETGPNTDAVSVPVTELSERGPVFDTQGLGPDQALDPVVHRATGPTLELAGGTR